MKTTTIQLAVRTQTGSDPAGAPEYTEELIDVPSVLVGLPTSQEITDAIQLYGKKIEYTLGIPKGDVHVWENTDVIIWGKRYQTIGYQVIAEAENIPLIWGSTIKVARYG